nr:hypothetical protein [Microbacterium sp. Root53]
MAVSIQPRKMPGRSPLRPTRPSATDRRREHVVDGSGPLEVRAGLGGVDRRYADAGIHGRGVERDPAREAPALEGQVRLARRQQHVHVVLGTLLVVEQQRVDAHAVRIARPGRGPHLPQVVVDHRERCVRGREPHPEREVGRREQRVDPRGSGVERHGVPVRAGLLALAVERKGARRAARIRLAQGAWHQLEHAAVADPRARDVAGRERLQGQARVVAAVGVVPIRPVAGRGVRHRDAEHAAVRHRHERRVVAA